MQGGCLKCHSQTHCPVPHLLVNTVFYNISLSSSETVHHRALAGYFLLFIISECWDEAHIVSVRCNEATSKLFSQGDFMERGDLQHSYSHLPVCSFEPFPLSLNEHLPFYRFSVIFSLLLCSFTSFKKKRPTCPLPELTNRDEPFEA